MATKKKTEKPVIVRCRDAGVHFGYLAAPVVDGSRTVHLTRARRMWRWYSGATLSEAAVTGIDPTKSRIAVEVPEITLLDACEVIPCTPVAVETFARAKWTT